MQPKKQLLLLARQWSRQTELNAGRRAGHAGSETTSTSSDARNQARSLNTLIGPETTAKPTLTFARQHSRQPMATLKINPIATDPMTRERRGLQWFYNHSAIDAAAAKVNLSGSRLPSVSCIILMLKTSRNLAFSSFNACDYPLYGKEW